jgi:hypothetical protein
MRPILFAAVFLLMSAGHLHAEDIVAGDSRTFIPDFVYRIVAMWVCYFCGNNLWRALVERKIELERGLLDFYTYVVHRDTAPVQYWIQIGLAILALTGGVSVVIFGWHPET